jgi:hypothetical protein
MGATTKATVMAAMIMAVAKAAALLAEIKLATAREQQHQNAAIIGYLAKK